MQHEHYKQVPVCVCVSADVICDTEQCIAVRVTVKQETAVVLHPVEYVADRNDIFTDGNRIETGKIEIIVFVTGERLFIRRTGQIGCRDRGIVDGGDIKDGPRGVLVKAPLHLFRKPVHGIGAMVIAKFQGTPVSELVSFSICLRFCLVPDGETA